MYEHVSDTVEFSSFAFALVYNCVLPVCIFICCCRVYKLKKLCHRYVSHL